MAILFFFLNLNPHKGRTFHEHVSDFDFLGLFLIVGGVLCLLIGLNSGQTSCQSFLRSESEMCLLTFCRVLC
jgi:hypothetical protein